MAIRISNPNTIGTQTEAMFNVTNSSGKNLIDDLSSSITSLKSHWEGSDAVANLADLAKVYTAVTDLIKNLQKLIVSVNNDEVLPLQKHINASGGTCAVGSELSFSLNVDSDIEVPTAATEIRTDDAITSDAETFNVFPTKFENFVNELNATKDELFNNWKEGANRAEVEKMFTEFNGNVPDFKAQITKVRDNLNIVAENKKNLL